MRDRLVRWLRGNTQAGPGPDEVSAPPLREALRVLRERWPQTAAGERAHGQRPVFLLASTWRSGSTLLQRMVMAGGEALVWGEPWAHADLVRRLADSLRAVLPEHPPEPFFLDARAASSSEPLHEQWIGNLYPEPPALAEAHRAFFRTLYAEPAARRGCPRWGFKEVRLDAEHAAYLVWLFPQARLVFLCRSPYDAWRSYRVGRRPWFDRWPTELVTEPAHFGRLWRMRTESFRERQDELGALFVRYEDVRGGGLGPRLAEHLGLAISEAPLARVLTGSRPSLEPVPAREVRLLEREVEPLASRLGYHASRAGSPAS